MIPSDLVNLPRVRLDAAIQQVAPSQAVSDLLSELVPGQRILADIQAALPNGTYRAMISQREVTLALPFSAKSGDSLEMEVVENNGRTALAVIANPKQAATAESSAATSLSRTGQLIATLLADVPDKSKGRATPLSGNQPLLANPKLPAEQLAPLLKQAISSSGLFYEAHLARWTNGQLNLAELLKEPQAQAGAAYLAQAPLPKPDGKPSLAPQAQLPPATNTPAPLAVTPKLAGMSAEAANLTPAQTPSSPPPPATSLAPSGLAADLAPLIRQQLESLASNTYIWHGQIWPGQEMLWEMVEEDGRNGAQDEGGEPASTWNTRLRLNLPHLGEIQARIGLTGHQISLHLTATNPETREQLRGHGQGLASQFEAAGLTLGGFMVDKNEPDATP